ncbi:MAG: serine/threonine protein kinase [Myxococcales bacterium]|nr:serine/threonine protein kinase [Myxococcales bacterium]
MSTETRDDTAAPTGSPDTAHAETLAQIDEGSHSTIDAPPPLLDELPEASFEPEPAEPTTEPPKERSGEPRPDLVAHRSLGQGGMGRVLLATQRSLRRRVAVKSANDQRASSSAIVREGVVTGMLEHPNIPPVHALLRSREGKPVLVMKHIEGVSWAAVLADPEHPIRAESPLFIGLDAREANLEILAQLCNALDFAHARGIVHRDIKPDNVMLGRFGEVYLIDWGIAFNRAWHADGAPISLVGTAAYMAPEMVLRVIPDARTDVYLLGATLHCALVGAPPHEDASVDAALAKALECAPFAYDEDVPDELAALCRRAMSRNRDDRPQSARAFREALQAFRSHRASNAICHETDARLDALVSLLAAPTRDDSARGRLLLECRFGYGQALKAWPESPQARDGLRRLYRALARDEIAHDNARGARDFANEIPGGDEEIEEELRALEARLAREAAAHRTLDFRQAARERAIFLVASIAFLSTLMAWRIVAPVHGQPLRQRHVGLLVVGLVLDLYVGGIIALLWKRLSRSEINRKLAFSAAFAFAAVTINRALGVVFLPHPSITLAADGLVIVSSITAVSSFVSRSLSWSLVPMALAIVGVCVDPQRTPIYFNLGAILFAVSAIVIFRHHEKKTRPRAT